MTTTQLRCCCDAPKELTTAQTVFDCDDLKKEIFSYCLPQYPIVTKDMIDSKMQKWKALDIKRTENLEQKMPRRGRNWKYGRRWLLLPCWKADWLLTMEEIKYYQSFETLKEFAICRGHNLTRRYEYIKRVHSIYLDR